MVIILLKEVVLVASEIICLSLPAMSVCAPCESCFCATLPRCPEEIIIDSDFTPDEAITLEIEDKFGNKYRIEDTAVYAGSAVFSTEDLPEGLLYSGTFTFRLFTIVAGYCDEPRLFCEDFYCVTVTFENVTKEPIICCEAEPFTCAYRLFLLLNDHTMNVDLTTPITFITIIVQGTGVINLPNISDVADQDVQIRIIPLTTDNILINPGATDSVGNGVIGAGSTETGIPGGVLILTIDSDHNWGIVSQAITTV